MIATVLAVAPLSSQQTHLVGPSGLPQIADAIAIAQTGDLILVEPGSYAAIAIRRGLRIRAITAGTVAVAAVDVASSSGAVHLSGLSVGFAGAGTGSAAMIVGGGEVTIENCTIWSQALLGVALRVGSATVHLLGCQVLGTNVYPPANQGHTIGMSAGSSWITAVDCRFRGSPTFYGQANDAPAIDLTRCRLHASHIDVTGGGGFTFSIPAPGIVADAQSSLWISDSTVMGGSQSTCSIVAPGATGHLDRCTVAPVVCAQPPQGPLLGVSRQNPPVAGQPFRLDFDTESGGLLAVRVTTELQQRAFPFVEPVWWADDAALGVGFFVADVAGHYSAAWTIPNDPWLTNLVVWFHTIGLGATLPLQVAPPVGGLIR